MSIKILTLHEAQVTLDRVARYGECAEVLYGTAKDDYICDNSDMPIPKGFPCAAVMVLPYKSHPNYEHQKNMLNDYVEAI